MISKVSRKNFLDKYPHFATADYRRNVFFYPDGEAYHVLHLEAKSAVGLCNKVSEELTKICKELGFGDLNFLGDTAIPWLYREHEYNPVKKAQDYLRSNKISRSFNGSINVSIDELPIFLKHLFWLIRCNGVVFIPHFSDSGFNIIGNICKYGNIHLTTLNSATQVAFDLAVQQTQLNYIEDGSCGGERIPGRITDI